MKPYVILAVYPSCDVSNRSFGRKFIDNFISLGDEYFPSKIGNSINNLVTFKSVDHSLDYWCNLYEWDNTMNDGFAWRRSKKVKYEGTVYSEYTNIKGQKYMGKITVIFGYYNNINYYDIFRKICALSEAEYGMLHLISDVERTDKRVAPGWSDFRVGSSSPMLRRGVIPQLAWANCFGARFMKNCNLPMVQRAVFEAEVSSGYIIFRLTSDISDIVSKYNIFVEEREKVKLLFDPQIFID